MSSARRRLRPPGERATLARRDEGVRHDAVPHRRGLPGRRRPGPDVGLDPRGGPGPPRLLRGAHRRARGQRRARLVHDPDRPRPRQDRPVRRRGARRHRRPLPGVQGVDGRLPGRRGRLGGARPRDRLPDVRRPRSRRPPDAPAHPRAPGHGPRARGPRADGRLPAHGGCLQLSATPAVDDLLRTLAPQVVGIVSRRFGDFDSAEDAVQEALLAASRHWPVDGVPDEPRAWLVTAASRRLVDRWRSDAARREREARVIAWEVPAYDPVDHDDSLTVMLLCCHPSLTPASAIALTLRAVGGLTTGEIARAFLVPEATMAQRISRAKATIRASGEPFRMPSAPDRDARLRSVLHVLYLLFNEGYASTHGQTVQRIDISREAIRLTRLLVAGVPDHAEALGLLALMLLLEARSPARSDASGALVPLPEQDRSRWDRALVAEGLAVLARALAVGVVGEYQLQAAIAAVHDRAPTAAATDWPEILSLYGLLEKVTGNPVVTLNRAVAVAMVDGPRAALEVVDGVEDRLGTTHRWLAVRGQLLEMAGQPDEAAATLDAAAGVATNDAERRHLTMRAARLRTPQA